MDYKTRELVVLLALIFSAVVVAVVVNIETGAVYFGGIIATILAIVVESELDFRRSRKKYR